MKRLFISQPMNGLSDEDILNVRNEAIISAKNILNEDVELVDTFFTKSPKDATPLWYLGESIKLLSTADVAYFVRGWTDYRGCVIEHTCAKQYGINVIDEELEVDSNESTN